MQAQRIPPYGPTERRAWQRAMQAVERAANVEGLSKFDRAALLAEHERMAGWLQRRIELGSPPPRPTPAPLPPLPAEPPQVPHLVADLGLPPSIAHDLEANGIKTTPRLRELSPKELRAMDGFNTGRARLIRWALAAKTHDVEKDRRAYFRELDRRARLQANNVHAEREHR